jgi:hypothetical protein
MARICNAVDPKYVVFDFVLTLTNQVILSARENYHNKRQ